MIYTYRNTRFREARMEDAAFFVRFMNEDAQIKRNLGGWVSELMTIEQEQEYLKKHVSANQSEQFFAIEDAQGKLIGSCSIFDWEPRARKCTVGINIADPAARGKGHGSDAMEMLLLIAFTELNCHKVKLGVFSWNENAIRLYERKGFVREGVLREEAFTAGKWHDEYIYGLLYEDWKTRIATEGRPASL